LRQSSRFAGPAGVALVASNHQIIEGGNPMRTIIMAAAAGAMLFGSLTTAQIAQAAQTTTHDTVVYTQPAAPKVEALDCRGGTGAMGCGPGWFWRDGWRGWACYPC
jgi:hypothetical protein